MDTKSKALTKEGSNSVNHDQFGDGYKLVSKNTADDDSFGFKTT